MAMTVYLIMPLSRGFIRLTSSLIAAEEAMRRGHRVIMVTTDEDDVSADEMALPDY